MIGSTNRQGKGTYELLNPETNDVSRGPIVGIEDNASK